MKFLKAHYTVRFVSVLGWGGVGPWWNNLDVLLTMGLTEKGRVCLGKSRLISLESVKVKPFFICSYLKEGDSLFSLYKEYLFTLSIGNSSPKLLHMSNYFSFNLPLKVTILAYQGSIYVIVFFKNTTQRQNSSMN